MKESLAALVCLIEEIIDLNKDFSNTPRALRKTRLVEYSHSFLEIRRDAIRC
jgi:hypothetical protein